MPADLGIVRLFRDVARWRGLLGAGSPPADAVQGMINRALFLRLCEARGIEPEGSLLSLSDRGDSARVLADRLCRAENRYGPLFASSPAFAVDALDDDATREFLRALYSPSAEYQFGKLPAEVLGQVYEQYLAEHDQKGARKAEGIYYTPKDVARTLVDDTLGRACDGLTPELLAGVRIVDPSCGSGVFLLAAYERLLDIHLEAWLHEPAARRRGHVIKDTGGRWILTPLERRRILQSSIFGVDLDPLAIEITRLSLLLKTLEGKDQWDAGEQLALFVESAPIDLGRNLRCGNSLLEADFASKRSVGAARVGPFDWEKEFEAVTCGGFDVVVGNPPWGQKDIVADEDTKRYLRERYPSTKGIFDWFRPFIELGVRLTRPGGHFGMVLPDVVLLKDYEPTRRFLLENLVLTKIAWLGMAFPSATIDAVTIAGKRGRAPDDHRVSVLIDNGPGKVLAHELRQSDFSENPRSTFNLFLTDEKRALIQCLSRFPKLGSFFTPHEGIHSGNIRDELFVSQRIDDTCRELLFGRDELVPHGLRWAGRYVRLGALPTRRSPERYANLGKTVWHESPKILVRRTGDQVTAAVDTIGRYASNNFFLLLPAREHPLSLDGLCAVLNSRLITWFFRTIEPREGRVFAELKIKHLVDFPLPDPACVEDCRTLNDLGAKQRALASRHEYDLGEWASLDGQVQSLILRLFSLERDPNWSEEKHVKATQVPYRRTA